jgi:hypothetical protein
MQCGEMLSRWIKAKSYLPPRSGSKAQRLHNRCPLRPELPFLVASCQQALPPPHHQPCQESSGQGSRPPAQSGDWTCPALVALRRSPRPDPVGKVFLRYQKGGCSQFFLEFEAKNVVWLPVLQLFWSGSDFQCDSAPDPGPPAGVHKLSWIFPVHHWCWCWRCVFVPFAQGFIRKQFQEDVDVPRRFSCTSKGIRGGFRCILSVQLYLVGGAVLHRCCFASVGRCSCIS